MTVDSPYQKYDFNLYNKTIELAQKASQVGNVIQTIQGAMGEFEKIIESIISSFPQNDAPASFSSLLNLTMNFQVNLKTELGLVAENYRKLSDKLKGPWDWKEKFSTYERIKKQQIQEIFNIQTYRCFINFLIDAKNNCHFISQNEVFDDNKLRPFILVSDKLVSDRKKLLSLDYTQPINQILKQENRQNTVLPEYFEKIMYKLYYEKELEGAFRQCAGVTEMVEYVKYIGIIDFQLTDYILLSAIVKKYLRETTEPVWPQSQFDQLMFITGQYASSPIQWKMKFRSVYQSVPSENKVFIESLIALCIKIINNPTSKMNIQNMSICIAPGFIRKSAINDLTQSSHQLVFIAFSNMLTYAKELFPDLGMKFIESRYDQVMNPHTLYKDTFNEKLLKQPTTSRSPIASRSNRWVRQQSSIQTHKRSSAMLNRLSIKQLC
ncbi:RhoGAP domain containing protein [Entamoeba histolytica HM-1:IMSS-B]|uniref:RhoGAP domain containing protein n=6 Tax=Entamoeba histolytica TaxID=5759 RepID=C4LVA5_ENTH1|nr:RhoGAP domain containing protein [Entamoeba histolytica HM-1:IMSS]EMD45034.1 RhoGAP domain containing protein [Entamoeba histolytica KU27]EMH75026.1 RhoGAP domain containing protein [Entamoeba histolytica HM-1:IMSS-B]EMS10756.1 RhoGAP domain containing protein [Entamoeba histolytica HM-3:IMSS]ENY65471.1 RhoGAP domain containing protein [Entamoeba histolytica HM-1:IMSS-A]GAT92512.1 rhogap domain containing protein [Entamoeba histolytica]|eukprot:XP_656709.2 RhoGAP domain containing protein [Entamoeba histolytica HM-1:IMSS]